MLEKLEVIYNNYRNLEEQLSDPTVLADMERFTKINKDYKNIEPVANAYLAYRDLLGNIETSKRMLQEETDEEMRELAKEELNELLPQLNQMEEEIKILLVPKDEEDTRDVYLEVRSGTGGDEASLFAGDLLRMYSRYCDRMGWKWEIVEENVGTAGGYNKAVMEVHGDNVYGMLKFESGVHRVQRVPETEAKGRVHTSAATVAVLPILEIEDVHINKADLKIDVFRASGAGGQHVNRTESAVRITHNPTGIVVECQEARSQIKNREIAMTKLFNLIQEKQRSEAEGDVASHRRSLIGSGDRSDKIRTYNFPQNRITDHRIDLTVHNLSDVLEGNMTRIVEELRMAETADKMQAMDEI